MKLTLQTQNHWRYAREGGAVDVIHVGCALNSWYANVFVSVLGFGLGLTLWRKHPDPIEAYAWEPIETDGWAGEPRGREHGA